MKLQATREEPKPGPGAVPLLLTVGWHIIGMGHKHKIKLKYSLEILIVEKMH